MEIEWDPAKAAVNVKKHGVDFADAAVALEDENALTIEDAAGRDERRFITLALGPGLKVLAIVHSAPDPETVRIISARKADHAETGRYFGGIDND
ncbi:MAG: BrnT family toxin [Xanthomonadales bacterium]|jgi:hypothetical protein|nr:BrnT family toxin [Xanthomonadales bacterium]